MMWYAFLLACGSSTDNFAVGASLGISHRPLPPSTNAIISLLNATGAFVSAAGGHYFLGGDLGPKNKFASSSAFAALIFAYLATEEWRSWWRRSGNRNDGNPPTESTIGKLLSSTGDPSSSSNGNNNHHGGYGAALRIAIPMTLNNLAGVIAGGAVGIDPRTAGILALAASYVLMKLGHATGAYARHAVGRYLDTRVVSGCIFGMLAVMQLVDLL